MLKDIVKVYYLGDYHLHLYFEDGVDGIVDVAELIDFDGVFTPIQEVDYFALVSVNPELGTICWPNGADLDPDVLYSVITGEPIDILEPSGIIQ